MDFKLAQKSNMVISVANSQLIETILDIKNVKIIPEKINELIKLKKSLKKKISKNKNLVSEYISVVNYLENIFYIPEIISITFEHNSHFKTLVKKGLVLNGKKYVRFMAGAGQLRRKTVLFIDADFYQEINKRFENGIDLNKEINMSKFGAYFGLYSSSGKKVSSPRYVVVKDFEFIKKEERVDFVTEENNVEERTIDIKVNSFDGMGLISPQMSKTWSIDLGLEKEAVQFIVRAPFTKGLLVSFPFHLMAKENNIAHVEDIYGHKHDIEEIDVIITESQFKMASHYKSIKEHLENSKNNKLFWFVTRTNNPDKDKDSFWTSYQYIQVLKEDIDIEKLTKDTLQFFSSVSIYDRNSSVLYLSGGNLKENMEIESVDNYYLKLLLLSKDSINDPYVRSHLTNSLNKKIRESYTGKLLVEGNYSFLIVDPYALSQHALGLPVTGILRDGEFYSDYWNSKERDVVVAGRSPLTWRSELLKLNIVSNVKTKKWFSHIYSGTIISAFGNDMMKFADGDADGDLVFTTSNEQMIEGAYGGLPVTYEKKSTPKTKFDINSLPEYEIKSFGTKIGLVTNYSTTMMAMLPFYKSESPEREELIKRLKVCRKLQGEQINSTKGLKVGKIPEWSKRKKGDVLHNNLLINKRPFFMKYLYPYKSQEYKNHIATYDVYSWMKWGISIETLLGLEFKTKEQDYICEKFKNNSPLIIGSNSIMERVSRYMVQNLKEIKLAGKNIPFDYRAYLSEKNKEENEEVIKGLETLIKEYNQIKKTMFNSDAFENKENAFEYIKNKSLEISYDYSLLVDMAIILCYKYGKNKNFVHDIFSDGIINNLLSKTKKIKIPIQDNKGGDFTYMYNRYSFREITINEN